MRTSVLLSIKPHFAEAILNGLKKFEFRRKLFKDRQVDTVVIYASKPVSKLVGEFLVAEIIASDPEDLWRKTGHQSGIDREYFYDYFSGCDQAYAIKIGAVVRYESPKDLDDALNIQYPPQSFRYLESSSATADHQPLLATD